MVPAGRVECRETGTFLPDDHQSSTVIDRELFSGLILHPDQGGADGIAGFKEIGKGNRRLQPLGDSREKGPGCGPNTDQGEFELKIDGEQFIVQVIEKRC